MSEKIESREKGFRKLIVLSLDLKFIDQEKYQQAEALRAEAGYLLDFIGHE